MHSPSDRRCYGMQFGHDAAAAPGSCRERGGGAIAPGKAGARDRLQPRKAKKHTLYRELIAAAQATRAEAGR